MTSTGTIPDMTKFLMHSQCEEFNCGVEGGGELYINAFISFVENVDQMRPQKYLVSISFLIYEGINGEKNRVKHLLMSVRNRDTSLPTTFILSTRSKVFHPLSKVCYSSTGKTGGGGSGGVSLITHFHLTTNKIRKMPHSSH